MYFWVFFVGQVPLQEVLQEKESRTLQRILAGPVTLNQFLLSKMIRGFGLCTIIQILLLLLSSILFGINWGNPLKLVLVIGIGALALTGVLAFIQSLGRTREQANAISSIALIVFALVGGSMFPFENLPGFLQALGKFSPNRWAILAIQGVARGKPWIELLQPLVILSAIGVLGTLAALALFRRQLGLGNTGSRGAQ
jgi:ABC-2 type transport system permease protein